MRGHSGLSPLFVFLAVMGGLEYFGLPGLLYGPLILTFAAAILYLYKEEFPTAPRCSP
jgi:predicted PurR-regulated permease PerM